MEERKTIWTGHFLMVFAMSLFSGMAAYMTYPLITKYALTIKDDITLASTISGLMSLSSLIICPFVGIITDSFNKKKILQISAVFYCAILLAHIAAVNIPLLFIVRLLVGFSFSINSVTGTVFATHFIPREKMAEGLGYSALASILAQAIGPGLGMQLVEMSGYHLTFLCAALCAFVSLVIVTLLPYEEEAPQRRSGKIRISDVIAFEYTDYLLIAALLSIGNGWVTTFLALIGDERGIGDIGLFFTVYSIAMVFFRPWMGTLHDRKGIYHVLIPAIICASAGIYLIGIGQTLWVMLAASILKAIGQGTGTPSLQTEVMKKMDKEKSGVAASTIMIGMHIGNAFGPMLGGRFVQIMGYRDMFVWFAIASAVMSFVLMYIRYRRDRKNEHTGR